MINEVLNKNYKKIGVLSVIHTDPSIFNRLLINFFRSKGLYEEHYSKDPAGFKKGSEFKDWDSTRSMSSTGMTFHLYDSPKPKGDISYLVEIGFDGATANVRAGAYGITKKLYKFSVANMKMETFLEEVWKRMNQTKDSSPVNSKTEWAHLQDAVNKKFKRLKLEASMSLDGGVHFYFSPTPFKSLGKKMSIIARKIFNPSDFGHDTGWISKKALEELITSIKFIKTRMSAMEYKFTNWDVGGRSQEYFTMNFNKGDESKDIEEVYKHLTEKLKKIPTEKEFYEKLIVKLFEDPVVKEYLGKNK